MDRERSLRSVPKGEDYLDPKRSRPGAPRAARLGPGSSGTQHRPSRGLDEDHRAFFTFWR